MKVESLFKFFILLNFLCYLQTVAFTEPDIENLASVTTTAEEEKVACNGSLSMVNASGTLSTKRIYPPYQYHIAHQTEGSPIMSAAELGRFYDPNAVYIGISGVEQLGGPHHYYLVAGNLRLDGQMAERIKLAKKAKFTQGVIFKLIVDAETRDRVVHLMGAEQQNSCVDCVDAVFGVLGQAGIRLGEGNGKPSSFSGMVKNATALLNGTVFQNNQNVPMELFASSQTDLEMLPNRAREIDQLLEAKMGVKRETFSPLHETLMDFAKRGNTYRKNNFKNRNDIWLLYKNDPFFFIWLRKQKPVYRDTSDLLMQYQTLKRGKSHELQLPKAVVDITFSNKEASRKPQDDYFRTIALLRAGDTITVGVKKIHLGKFLGAGNASQVFDQVDDLGMSTGNVVKIPLITDVVFEDLKTRNPTLGNNYILQARGLVEAFVKNRPVAEGLDTLEIIEHGPNYEYVIVPRRRILEDGHDFMTRYHLEQKAGGLTVDLTTRHRRLLELKALAIKSGNSRYGFEGGTVTMVDAVFPNRHFAWDLDKADWVLIDW